MISDLPSDLISFLDRCSQLDFGVEKPLIGKFRLKTKQELELSLVRQRSQCINDPYEIIDGDYHYHLIDLIAESDDYDPHGLFCWIVELGEFGCVDLEHETILSFPNTNWEKIVASPATYFDAQWSPSEVGVNVLPWLKFPFHCSDGLNVLLPYGRKCTLHGKTLSEIRRPRLDLFESMQRREAESWFKFYLEAFPCSGHPIQEDEEDLIACSSCREAEESWLTCTLAASIPVDANQNNHGWVQCPGCGIRFSTHDRQRFVENVHLSCGQLIRVISD